jgi:hypothetical protein
MWYCIDCKNQFENSDIGITCPFCGSDNITGNEYFEDKMFGISKQGIDAGSDDLIDTTIHQNCKCQPEIPLLKETETLSFHDLDCNRDLFIKDICGECEKLGASGCFNCFKSFEGLFIRTFMDESFVPDNWYEIVNSK